LTKRFSKISKFKMSFPFRFFNPRQLLNISLLIGPYGKLSSPSRWFNGLSLKKLIASKHGINFGAMKSRIPEVLNTQDQKIDIAPSVFLEGMRNLNEQIEFNPKERNTNEFTLIGRRHLRSNNSWMHNVKELVRGKNRCTAMMNTADAKALNLKNNELILVKSKTGEIEIPVEITNDIMNGVVSIPHGFGHHKKGTRLSVASQKNHAGVSVNNITDQNRMDKVTGNAAFSGQKITVSKYSNVKTLANG